MIFLLLFEKINTLILILFLCVLHFPNCLNPYSFIMSLDSTFNPNFVHKNLSHLGWCSAMNKEMTTTIMLLRLDFMLDRQKGN